MQTKQSKTIDGLVFTVQMLPAMRATLMVVRLGKLLGVPLLKSLSGVQAGGKGASLKNLDVGQLAQGVDELFGRLSEAEVEELFKIFFETALVKKEGKEFPLLPNFDSALMGKPFTAFKALKFALEVNFGDFFAALPGLLAAAGGDSTLGETSQSAGPATA